MEEGTNTVRLPRARPAPMPLALAALIGFAVGLMVGHPIAGAAMAAGVWYLRKSRRIRRD